MYFSEMLTWCFLALVANTYAIPLTYSNSWTGGCQGTVQLHANADIHGWRATFTFDGPVDKFEVRLSISKHFILWNLVLVYLFLSAVFLMPLHRIRTEKVPTAIIGSAWYSEGWLLTVLRFNAT